MLQSFLKKQFELVSCNMCGEQQTDVVATNSRFNLSIMTVICRRCGLIYHNPRMTLAGFAEFYKYDYRRFIAESEKSIPELFAQQIKHGQRILNFIGADIASSGLALDIGSGPGGQLYALSQAYGINGVGIEPAQEHAEWARTTYGLDIRAGMLEDIKIEANNFDLVIISQTLNHLLNPFETLCRAYSYLKPGGKIYVETIDFVYWALHAPLTQVTTIDHPYMFVAETLSAMLEQAGFNILKKEVDAMYPQVVREPDQPSLHIRILAIKGTKGASVVYPDYREILNRIRVNQLVYQKKQKRRWALEKIDQAKGLIHLLIGDRLWSFMKHWIGK